MSSANPVRSAMSFAPVQGVQASRAGPRSRRPSPGAGRRSAAPAVGAVCGIGAALQGFRPAHEQAAMMRSAPPAPRSALSVAVRRRTSVRMSGLSDSARLGQPVDRVAQGAQRERRSGSAPVSSRWTTSMTRFRYVRSSSSCAPGSSAATSPALTGFRFSARCRPRKQRAARPPCTATPTRPLRRGATATPDCGSTRLCRCK